MHICLVAPNDALADPRARVSRYLLERAGHEVTVVLPHPGPAEPGVVRVVTRGSVTARVLRRLRPREESTRMPMAALTEAAAETGASLFVPTDARSLEPSILAAKATGGAVSRTPKMSQAGDVDLIDLAPTNPGLAAPISGVGPNHTPDDHRRPYEPEPGRHSGRRVVLCYRRSEINPGRYLEEGLLRSGAEVKVETEGIDLDEVDPDTSFVIFVEGPYPALSVTGSTTVPTLFWFHHGEHHLHANLRLVERYRADAVLMAHSWHLAYWLPTPVHRFPFGVATELLDPRIPLPDRRYDVAMVGAKLHSGGPYGRRQALVAELEGTLPSSHLGFREQVSAEEMADLYGNARIVINEGGTRHYPITMRVLEAVGSGAVLLSDRLPGMEMILDEGSQYAVIGEDIGAEVTGLLGDPDRMEQISQSALGRAMGLHTYDHRVDELFAIAAATPKRKEHATSTTSPLSEAIDEDVEVQRVAQLNAPELAGQLQDREVWDAALLDRSRLGPGKMEAIALRTRDVTEHEDLIQAARRYIYIDGGTHGLDDYLRTHAPQAEIGQRGSITRVDLMAQSYRIMPFERETS
jgi:Glycosyl transferases group 1